MKQIAFVLSIFSFVILSCGKENRVVDSELKELKGLKLCLDKVTKESFVFCLDTIKSKNDFKILEKEYCNLNNKEQVYLYLSSYSVYVKIRLGYFCDNYLYGCNRSILDFIVDKNGRWLIDQELVNDVNQKKIDSVLYGYYKSMYELKRTPSISLHFNEITSNKERDELYLSILLGYKSLKENMIDINKPLILFLGESYPQPISVIPIEDKEGAIDSLVYVR